MHTLYFNLPWILDEKEYNCSTRTLAEWQARGSINPKQGFFFATTGSFYVTVYILSMIGMFRAKLLHIPCYRLMFFNGFLDIMDIIAGSLVTSYFHFTGVVGCSNIVLNVFLAHFILSTWSAASVICIALAINRVVEMIPPLFNYRFLFQGRNVYIWMAVSVALFIIRPFVTPPAFYNSKVAAFLFAPVITDDLDWEMEHYTPLLYALHNTIFPSALIILYSVLCIYVFKMKGFSKIDRTQLQLFLQSLVICASTANGSIFYIAAEFIIPVPWFIFIISNVMWQLSHGIHGLVYMVLNKKIREEVLKLFGFKENSVLITSTISSNTKACKELETVNGRNEQGRK